MGYGVNHAKWSTTAGVTFEPRQIASISNDKRAKTLFDMGLRISKKDFKDGKLKMFTRSLISRKTCTTWVQGRASPMILTTR